MSDDFITIKRDSADMEIIAEAFQFWYDKGFQTAPPGDGSALQPHTMKEIRQTIDRLGIRKKLGGLIANG